MIFINSDYVRVVRTRITTITHSAPSTSSVLSTTAISVTIFRLDVTNNRICHDGTLSRDKREANWEEKSPVLTSKSDNRAHHRITWPNRWMQKRREREGKGKSCIVILGWKCALRCDGKIAIDDVRRATDDNWREVGVRTYNFANSNLKKKNLTMQKRSERCSGLLARGSNVRIQTRLCNLLGGDCMYVSHMQVSHQKYLLRIHIYVYDGGSIIRNFRILAALTRQRITYQARVCPVRDESRERPSRHGDRQMLDRHRRERVASACRTCRRGRSSLQ